MGFFDDLLDVISAPAKLFTGGGPLEKAAKSLFGSETGSLTPALKEVAKAASVADAKGNITAQSIVDGVLKAPGAIFNFAEKEAKPALNFAEKTLGDLKTKVEKVPIVGKELGAALGAVETPLKEVSALVGGAQEALKAGETAIGTAQSGVQAVRGATEAGKGLVSAVRAGDIGGAIEKGKQAIEKGQQAAEIGQMAVRQAGRVPEQLGLPRLAVQPRFGQQIQQIQPRGARVNTLQAGAPPRR